MIRRLVIASFCALVAIVLWCSQPAPIEAQGKKDEQAKQIQQLKKTVAERDQQIAKLRYELTEARKKSATASRLQRDLDAANQSLRDKDVQIATLQDKSPKAIADLTKENSALRKQVRELQTVKKATFVHTAILKLKKTDDAQVKKIYDEAVKTLAKIDGVRSVYVGKPAEAGTPELAQKGYQIGLVVLLDDADALQKFLDDPLHKQFNDKMGDYWDRPTIYDFQRDMDQDKKKDTK